ncbi:hypothetical protein CY652_18410 [Burkholderia sp. WAC0059]|nr:hypothetical protein CY652_18410 [Burkholderia sp. WAC0059]
MALAVAAACALAGGPQSASAAGAPSSYTVHPGQSLSAVAADIAQSHDPATLSRVGRALFAANPDAFMRHDPSRLKIGAVLDVPPGLAPAAAEPVAQTPQASQPAPAAEPASSTESGVSGTSSASASAAQAASGPTAAVPAAAAASNAEAVAQPAASAPAQASSGTTAGAVGSASGAATTIGASAAVTASSPVGASALSAAAAVAGSATTTGAAGASGTGSASVAVAAAPASNGHVWSGSIQAVPATGASGSLAAGPGGLASEASAPVSSLQQLLALKSRVLMALQKHRLVRAGASGQPAAGAVASSPGAASVPGIPAGSGVAYGTAPTASSGFDLSRISAGVASAIGAALLALIVALMIGRRKRAEARRLADENAAAAQPDAGQPHAGASDESAAHEAVPAATVMATHSGHDDADNMDDGGEDGVALHLSADRAGSSRETAGAEPAWPSHSEAEETLPPSLPDTAHDPFSFEPGHDSHDDRRTEADANAGDDLAGAAESGAAELPAEPTAWHHEETGTQAGEWPAHDAFDVPHDDEPVARDDAEPSTWETAQADSQAAPMAAEDFEPEPEEEPIASGPLDDAFHAADEPAPSIQPEEAAADDAVRSAAPSTAFSHEAVDVLDSLDMPLPPRVGEPMAEDLPSASAPAPDEPEPEPADPEEPVLRRRASAPSTAGAGASGSAAVAGLGAARFGALTLDFDLDLPPDSAEPVPVFTPEQLARIARNKLDLASEYIALGDLGGARTLINEVIESNDHETRADAQALLSTLAPLS